MALSQGKIVEIIFENAIETHEEQTQFIELVDTFKPEPGQLQNSENVIWRTVQQHAPVIEGFDLTGLETGIIEETYPAILGAPTNDFFEQRVDQLRNRGFWERRGKESGRKQASTLNKKIAELIKNTGSLFYRTNDASGFDAISTAQAILNERQSSNDERYMVLNDRDTKKYGSDLAGRETLKGRPADTWNNGQIGSQVAEFDLYTASSLPNLIGGASPGTTTTALVSEKPEAGSVDATSTIVTNIDYRTADIPVVATASYNVGDKIIFDNAGTPVQSVGLEDKTITGQDMTFSIVAIPDGTTLTIFPKPIALDDAALDVLEKAYANIDTQITSGAIVTRLNTDASARTNAFWCKDSIEVLGGDVPMELLSEFDGMKVIDSTMSNGQKMYMAYDGNLASLNFRCRLFTWYGLTNANPMANGVFVTF